MDPLTIFLIQLLMSLLVWVLAARYLALAPLDRLTAVTALSLLLIPHMLRHLGLVFLVPGVVEPSMPGFFANTAGYGDLAAAAVAIIAFLSLQWRWPSAFVIVAIANLVGIADLANALRQAEVIPHFGAAWYVPTFYVPLLLVTHALMIRVLYRETIGSTRVLDA